MEMSHRGPVFKKVFAQTEKDLRELAAIPDDFAVLFAAGGASFQFSAIPLNLCDKKQKVQYCVTGNWSKTAKEEAERIGVCGEVEVIYQNTERAPTTADLKDKIDPEAAYLYYCDNETIQGVQYPEPIDSPIPVVADMSSNFLSRPIDWSKFGIVYACAQKNFGPAGLTIVCVRKSLIGRELTVCPNLMRYSVLEKNSSMKNTPPTYAIYIAGLVFKWIMAQGGLKGIEEFNLRKSKKIYDVIDASDFWSTPADVASRSMMNVPFINTLGEENAKDFLAFCADRKLMTLAGHRCIGGFRASIYNSMPEEGVDALCQAMKDYEQAKK